MKYKTLLKNIYYAAKHLQELNLMLANDLMREDWERNKAKGSYDAYAYIVQMIVHSDSIGKTNYKKTFKMPDTFPPVIY